MGGINFGWLPVWVLSQDWFSRKLEICDFFQALRWSRRAWGRGVRAVSRLCVVYPGICLTTEEKSRKNLSQGKRRALGWSAPKAINLVDLAIAGDASTGLLTPATLGFPVRWRGQPSVSVSICRVAAIEGFPRQLTLNQSSLSGLWCGRQTDPRVSACYLRTRGHQ